MNIPEGAVVPSMTSTCHFGTFSPYLSTVRPLIDQRIKAVISRPHCSKWMAPGMRGLLSHGKRLRGGLLMATFSAFAHQDRSNEEVLDLAASVEIAHSVSLVLDDMIDGDTTRREQRAVHVIDGQSETLLGTIGALSLPYSITIRYGGAYTERLASTHRTMVAGEIADLRADADEDMRAIYDEVIALKTGALFSLATEFGGMAAGCSEEVVELLSKFGLLTGMVVQMADDISDMDLAFSTASSRHGSEHLLARIVGRDLPRRSNLDLRAQELLEERIGEAENALFIALKAEEKVIDPKSAERLRHAPSDMALMMRDRPPCERPGVSGDP